MSTSQLTKYYVNQAGSGLSSFEGVKFQHGKGIISILKSAGLPLLKYLTQHAFQTTANAVGDVLKGEPVKEAFKARSKGQLREIAGDLSDRAKLFEQTGRGRKRKRKSTTQKSSTLIKPKRKYKKSKRVSDLNKFF